MFDVLVANLILAPVSDTFMSDLGEYASMIINWELDFKYKSITIPESASSEKKKCSMLVIENTLSKINYNMQLRGDTNY